jgi:L-threonylcarbamoyladenylate synthase
MKTQFLQTLPKVRARNIARAAKLIRSGKLVAFPTETVYGLGANVFNERAIKEIFRVKGRPQDNPLIVHIHSLKQLHRLVKTVPMRFWLLAERFMPGPLTILLNKSDLVPMVVTAGLPTVAIRMPSHKIARALLKLSSVPIVAPSANVSGSPSPTRAEHVREDLDGTIAAILDGGSCDVGLESTVLDIAKRTPVILRPGAVTKEQLEAVLKTRVRVARPHRVRPASPGMKYAHYAPKAEVLSFEGKCADVVKAMNKTSKRLQARKLRVGVMAEQEWSARFCGAQFFSLGSGAENAAQRLFEGFRTLDKSGVDAILCQGFVAKEIGTAYMNRLRKAAGKRIHV